jgi:hypothetical protein
MTIDGGELRDLSRLVLTAGGGLEATGDVFQPYRLSHRQFWAVRGHRAGRMF